MRRIVLGIMLGYLTAISAAASADAHPAASDSVEYAPRTTSCTVIDTLYLSDVVQGESLAFGLCYGVLYWWHDGQWYADFSSSLAGAQYDSLRIIPGGIQLSGSWLDGSTTFAALRTEEAFHAAHNVVAINSFVLRSVVRVSGVEVGLRSLSDGLTVLYERYNGVRWHPQTSPLIRGVSIDSLVSVCSAGPQFRFLGSRVTGSETNVRVMYRELFQPTDSGQWVTESQLQPLRPKATSPHPDFR